jgi:endoglucanase
LQQIEHGVRWLLNFHRRFGSLGSGVIVPTLRQYVLLGDPSIQTDNRPADDSVLKSAAARTEGLWYTKVANRFSKIYDPQESLNEIETVVPDLDDRLVFLQTNPARQIFVAAGLALAARVLAGYEDALAAECLRTAEALWDANRGFPDDAPAAVASYGYRSNLGSMKLLALAELFLTTKKEKYRTELMDMGDALEKCFGVSGWAVGRALPLLDSRDFSAKAELAARKWKSHMDKVMGETPFGCPLTHVESYGMMHYFLHKAWPDIFSIEPMLDVLNFLLGSRPGRTTSSLVSGVGSDTPVVAYGFNRADWSYIPGGTFCNAINLIRPDLAEDKVWPFLWQEREYMTNTPCMFLFTVIAADKILNA